MLSAATLNMSSRLSRYQWTRNMHTLETNLAFAFYLCLTALASSHPMWTLSPKTNLVYFSGSDRWRVIEINLRHRNRGQPSCALSQSTFQTWLNVCYKFGFHAKANIQNTPDWYRGCQKVEEYASCSKSRSPCQKHCRLIQWYMYNLQFVHICESANKWRILTESSGAFGRT
jgi:hypothetical protein